MKALLCFSQMISDVPTVVCEVEAQGVSGHDHAELVGHGLVGALSIKHGVALFLASVSCEDGSFVMNPDPTYFRQHVTLKETPAQH